MNVKQLKWIFNKALFLIHAFEGRKLDEGNCEEMLAYVQKAYEDSRGNDYCKKIMLDVACAFDREFVRGDS